MFLFASGGNDAVARAFDISLNAMIWAGRIALLTLPLIVTLVPYRICLGLQRHDREVLDHGIETGVVTMLPTGEFIEAHQPLGRSGRDRAERLSYAGAPVPKRINRLRAAARLEHVRGFLYPVNEKPEITQALAELKAAEEPPDMRRVLSSRPGHGRPHVTAEQRESSYRA